ncbi:Fe3+/spermidine/putrescine ABC transporter ATP-binding protein [Pigmentiphaga litoralis]|uniref:ABC transporter ATP-binding protein n=1 Tax=Pigmentiphaga litoralis TaxID=516702 RepID=UPI001674A063|nr:ABC transporter ATP-binding protein [Pigmentiphaga litoralis]GGX01608.1 Fe3+/spermidine/putrescine ABC transporter ATP-binding protein [Pigmentiphaga litoralis]
MPVSSSTGAAVSIAGLVQRFGSHTVLDRVDLDVPAGHVLALLGPSGCGKTTLLKLLAGLMRPTEGRIAIGGQTVVDGNHFLPPEKRGLGMVFQDYALWPHMTVGRNVAFPLEMRGVGRREATTRVAHALDLVGLGGYDARQPGSLSGGQQQRVALARAIVARPQLLLFDEPLSNLDRDLRESLCGEIGALLRELGTTAVYVTHDHEEAFTLADTVAVMRGGRIQQMASPDALMGDPASLAVAEFLKLGAVAAGERTDTGWRLGQGIDLVSPHHAGGLDHAHAPGPGHLFIPHSALRPADAAPLRGTVVAQRYRSGHYATTVRVGPENGGFELSLLTHARLPLHAPIGLELDWTRLRWFPLAA